MSIFLGPLEDGGRIPPHQQTRISTFLLSGHGAFARQLVSAVPIHFRSGWQAELHGQFYRECEIVSLLARATSWVADAVLLARLWQWELTWLPRPADGAENLRQALLIDHAALGHALHTAVRPAALLPEGVDETDAFVVALRRLEFESSRLVQAQIMFLKSADLAPVRDAVERALERRRAQVRQLWGAVINGV